MNTSIEDMRFARLAEKVAPGSRLLRAWKLSGGMSAGMTAFELRQADGRTRRLIQRRPAAEPIERAARLAEDEFRLLEALQSLGLPAPQPCLLDTSGDLFPSAYLVLEYVEGEAQFAPAEMDSFTGQMAGMLARIHHADCSRLDRAGLLEKAEGFRESIGGPKQSLNQALGEGRIREKLEEVWPPLSRNPPALLHGDFWPGNLLWRGGQIAAVIDWEDARLGDPLTDLAISRLDLACIFNISVMQSFTAQYLSLAALDSAQLAEWDLWAALRFIRLTGGDLDSWAAFYPPLGREDITAQTIGAAFGEFVARALDNLAGRP